MAISETPRDPVASEGSLIPATPRALAVPAVQSVERSVKERRDVDVPLMNWWLATLIVIPVTLYIYGIVVWFKRIGRINRFHERKSRYYSAILDYTDQYAATTGKTDQVVHALRDLRAQVSDDLSTKVKPMSAGLAFVLCIVTLGIWSWVVIYKLNRAWYQFEVIEQDFDDKLSQIWMKLGLAKYPISFNVDASKQRSFGLYIVLSIVTLGIWYLVWDYKIHTDPDNLYREFHGVEDTVLQTVRAA